jgi:hypothetical protein
VPDQITQRLILKASRTDELSGRGLKPIWILKFEGALTPVTQGCVSRPNNVSTHFDITGRRPGEEAHVAASRVHRRLAVGARNHRRPCPVSSPNCAQRLGVLATFGKAGATRHHEARSSVITAIPLVLNHPKSPRTHIAWYRGGGRLIDRGTGWVNPSKTGRRDTGPQSLYVSFGLTSGFRDGTTKDLEPNGTRRGGNRPGGGGGAQDAGPRHGRASVHRVLGRGNGVLAPAKWPDMISLPEAGWFCAIPPVRLRR